MHATGRGVLKDYAEAVRWFRLAAEQGGAIAQYNLGRMYFMGRGILKDVDEAVRWFRLAAEQGHAEAQGSLSLMYFTGQGVRENHGRAHMWSNIASANGNDTAGPVRDALEISMTPAEIRRATKRARKCMASGYQDCEP